MQENYRNLGIAVIKLAADDYRRTQRALKRNPHRSDLIYEKEDIERFFRSDYFTLLTDADGGYILEKLKEES